MGFKFTAIKLPFVKVSSDKAGRRSYTWRVGAWSYNSRTGKQTVKLGKSARWESKGKTSRAKSTPLMAGPSSARSSKAAGKATGKGRTSRRMSDERQMWERKLAAGQVEGLRVPADIRGNGRRQAGTRGQGGGRGQGVGRGQGNSRSSRGAGVVHEMTPQERQEHQIHQERQRNKAAYAARLEGEFLQRLRAVGAPEHRLNEFLVFYRNPATRDDVFAILIKAEKARPKTDLPETGPQPEGEAPAQPNPPAGMCEAPTQDGTPCRNPRGGCPHHKNTGRSGARGRGRTRR